MIGIANRFFKTADQTVTNSVALVNATDLSFAIGANQNVFCHYHLPMSLGATGGFRFLFSAPAAPTYYQGTFVVIDCTTANTLFAGSLTNIATAFTNAAAVAGPYVVDISVVLENVTAGTLALQFAQNNAQATNTTILRGAYAEAILF